MRGEKHQWNFQFEVTLGMMFGVQQTKLTKSPLDIVKWQPVPDKRMTITSIALTASVIYNKSNGCTPQNLSLSRNECHSDATGPPEGGS